MEILMRLSEVSGSCIPDYTLKCAFFQISRLFFFSLIVPLGLLFASDRDPLLGTNLSFNIHSAQETVSVGKNILKGDGSWISNLQMEPEKGSGKKQSR